MPNPLDEMTFGRCLPETVLDVDCPQDTVYLVPDGAMRERWEYAEMARRWGWGTDMEAAFEAHWARKWGRKMAMITNVKV